MTPPHSAAPLDVIVETFPSGAWDSSACAVAREPVKALEQDEVVVVVAVRGGGGWSESVWAEGVIVAATRIHMVFDCGAIQATMFSSFSPG